MATDFPLITLKVRFHSILESCYQWTETVLAFEHGNSKRKAAMSVVLYFRFIRSLGSTLIAFLRIITDNFESVASSCFRHRPKELIDLFESYDCRQQYSQRIEMCFLSSLLQKTSFSSLGLGPAMRLLMFLIFCAFNELVFSRNSSALFKSTEFILKLLLSTFSISAFWLISILTVSM